MNPVAVLILLAHAMLGGWLGFRAPARGLVVLVAFVATTSGLYWYAGIGNLPSVDAYLLGLLLGALAGRAMPRGVDAEHGEPDGDGIDAVTRWVTIVLLAFAVSTALTLTREAAAGNPAASLAPTEFLGHLLLYSAPGLAGQLRWLFVAAVGPMLLLLGIHSLTTEGYRRSLLWGSLAGLTLTVSVPAIQAIWFNPWARPDTGVEIATGVSGLFHDEHSFAAYLVLGIGVAAGVSRGSFRQDARKHGWAFLALAAAAFTVLLFTNSRTGLVAGVLALSVMSVLAPWTRGRDRTRRTRSRAYVPMAAAGLLLASALLLAWPMARGIAHDGMTRIGASKLWEPLRPGVDVWQLLTVRARLLLWRKSLTLMAQRPIWGVGPDGFRRAETPPSDAAGDIPESMRTDNAHNYFLQVGTEYGLPALAAFIVLLATVLRIVGRAARRCPDPVQRGVLAGICGGQAGFLLLSLTAHPMLLPETQAVFWSLAALGVAMATSSSDGAPSVRSSSAG